MNLLEKQEMKMNWLNDRKIGFKLVGSFLVVSLLVVLVAAFGYIEVRNLSDTFISNYENNVLPVQYVGIADADLNKIRADAYYLIIYPTKITETEAEIDDLVDEIDNQFALYREAELTSADIEKLDAVESAWTDYKTELYEVIAQIENEGEEAALETLKTGEIAAAREEAIALMTELENQEISTMHDSQTEVQNTSSRTRQIIFGVGVIAVVVAIMLGILISRSILKPLGEGVTMMKELSAGNLGLRLKMRRLDEIGILTRAMDEFADVLQKINSQTKGSSASTTAATTEILATVNQFTASANEQSAAINETTTIVDEVRAVAEQTAERANEVAEESQAVVTVSENGQQSMEAIQTGMIEIREKVQAIAQDILALSEQTQQIGEIISTVNDIADQSNMLALNATIEAAKAGEHGKGFAVVASEVSNLADQSKQSAQNVRAILGDIQKATNAAVIATEQGTKGVEDGMVLAKQAGEVIDQLSGTIQKTSQAAQQIAASAHQQNMGMEQITQAMKDINQATVQFVAGARQSQVAAENLNSMAQALQETTEFFKE